MIHEHKSDDQATTAPPSPTSPTDYWLLAIGYWLFPVLKVWQVCIPYGRGMEKV